jgi:uncharacterized membrane protein (Fun14 family)
MLSTMSADPPPPADPYAPNASSRTVSGRAINTVGQRFSEVAGWKKALLVLAILMSIAGIAGSVTGAIKGKPPEVQQAQVRVEELSAVGQHSSLTAEQTQQLDQATAKVDEVKHWFYDQTAPQLWRIGLGFFIAFVAGFAARQFVKTMASLAALAVVLAGVAIYMGWIDAATAKSNLASGTGWVMERVDTFKDAVLKFAGASLSGTAGFAIGFMRSRK